MAIPLKSPRDVDGMRRAGALLWQLLGRAAAGCVPGATTRALDRDLADWIRAAGAEPVFPESGFPAASAISVNEEVAHAPPGPRILRDGEVVTIDAALRLDGWCADAAVARVIGARSADAGRLAAAARSAVDAAVAAVAPGRWWSDVASEAMGIAGQSGCSIVGEYAGHGIGRGLQEPPSAGFQRPGGPKGAGGGKQGAAWQDFVLRPGMVFTVEPVLVLGRPEVLGLDDAWTVVTADRSAAAHEERTVAVTRAGALVLTAP